MCISTLETANTNKSVCDGMSGYTWPAQTQILHFIFAITVTLMMISNTIKVT